MIIAIANNKGGVGKSTVTCNLGHALTRLKKRVLCADLDPQCNTTSLLLPANTKIHKSLYELLDPSEENINVASCIYPTGLYSHLAVLPNIPETAGLEPDLISNAPGSLFKLRTIFRDYALKQYDFVILDCPPNMGTFVLSALYASDFVIVPNEIDSAFSLEGLIKAMTLIQQIQQNGNADLRFLRLLVNKVDRRTSISRVAIEHLESVFTPDQVFKTTIPINVDFKMAERARQTVLKFKPGAPGAKAFRKLAEELLHILEGDNG